MNTKERTPVPVLGDGWFLLTAEDGEFNVGDKITADPKLIMGWMSLLEDPAYSIADWLGRSCRAARYFGPTKEPEPATKPIDWTKPVRTKDGRAVRVLCTDGPGSYPVAGYIAGDTNPRSWTLDGYFHINARDITLDLENAPQRIQREYWVNVYKDRLGSHCATQAIAEDVRENGCIACVKITIDCEEGEGL